MELRGYQREAVMAMLNAKGNSIAVLPTGSGKTIVIAEYINQHGGHVLVLSHVKEILGQNYQALARYLDEPIHMYSAGWDMRSVGRITVAGIQSVYKRADLFQDIDVVLIDECHLVNVRNTGMYRSFINQLGVPVIGLTATPFRLGQGYLHMGEASVFDNICYDLSDHIPILQAQGYLSKLKSKCPDTKMDVEGVRTVQGDYSPVDLAEKFADYESMHDIVNELRHYTLYKKWLVFCINIKHADIVAEMLEAVGISARAVHSAMHPDLREDTINAFKRGEVRALVNVNVLTTGFDAPDIDMIVMLRPTKSASLYSQIIGRGLRVATNKTHCLVLDYAGNIARLGPINDLKIDKEGKYDPNGLPPEKVCPECNMYISLAARVCPECGADLRSGFTTNLETESSELELVQESPNPKIKWWKVTKALFSGHNKVGSPTSVKISYYCGSRVFREWLCIEHKSRAGQMAERRLHARWDGPNPTTCGEFLENSDKFQIPKQIMVDERGSYPQIIDKKYG